jgi:hypothetical protein
MSETTDGEGDRGIRQGIREMKDKDEGRRMKDE